MNFHKSSLHLETPRINEATYETKSSSVIGPNIRNMILEYLKILDALTEFKKKYQTSGQSNLRL